MKNENNLTLLSQRQNLTEKNVPKYDLSKNCSKINKIVINTLNRNNKFKNEFSKSPCLTEKPIPFAFSQAHIRKANKLRSYTNSENYKHLKNNTLLENQPFSNINYELNKLHVKLTPIEIGLTPNNYANVNHSNGFLSHKLGNPISSIQRSTAYLTNRYKNQHQLKTERSPKIIMNSPLESMMDYLSNIKNEKEKLRKIREETLDIQNKNTGFKSSANIGFNIIPIIKNTADLRSELYPLIENAQNIIDSNANTNSTNNEIVLPKITQTASEYKFFNPKNNKENYEQTEAIFGTERFKKKTEKPKKKIVLVIKANELEKQADSPLKAWSINESPIHNNNL